MTTAEEHTAEFDDVEALGEVLLRNYPARTFILLNWEGRQRRQFGLHRQSEL